MRIAAGCGLRASVFMLLHCMPRRQAAAAGGTDASVPRPCAQQQRRPLRRARHRRRRPAPGGGAAAACACQETVLSGFLQQESVAGGRARGGCRRCCVCVVVSVEKCCLNCCTAGIQCCWRLFNSVQQAMKSREHCESVLQIVALSTSKDESDPSNAPFKAALARLLMPRPRTGAVPCLALCPVRRS